MSVEYEKQILICHLIKSQFFWVTCIDLIFTKGFQFDPKSCKGTEEQIAEIWKLKNKYSKMSITKLQALADENHDRLEGYSSTSEKNKDLQDSLADRNTFRNFRPDYEYWAKKPEWTIKNGAFMLLDIDPERCQFFNDVTGEFINTEDYLRDLKRKNASYKARQYFKYIDILYNAASIPEKTQINESNSPLTYIKWAVDCDFPVPPQLREAVEKYHGIYIDYKTLYEAEKKRADGIVAHNNEPSILPIDNKKRVERETLLWIAGVCLHKFKPSCLQANDKGTPLATHLRNHAKNNSIKLKSENTLVSAIMEIRETVAINPLVEEIVDEAEAILLKHTNK